MLPFLDMAAALEELPKGGVFFAGSKTGLYLAGRGAFCVMRFFWGGGRGCRKRAGRRVEAAVLRGLGGCRVAIGGMGAGRAVFRDVFMRGFGRRVLREWNGCAV